MNNKKIAMAGLLSAVSVVGSLFSFPLFGSRCAPVQHLVNITSAVVLGPWYGIMIAFTSSLLRNLIGLGTPMAFPGSMLGALLCGIIYKKTKKISLTLAAEILGTSILGGLLAYPISILFMGKTAGEMAFYVYIIPFFISSAVGALMAGLFLFTFQRSGGMARVQKM